MSAPPSCAHCQGSGLMWVERRSPTQVRCTCQPEPPRVMTTTNACGLTYDLMSPAAATLQDQLDEARAALARAQLTDLRDAVRAYLAAWDAFYLAPGTYGSVSAPDAWSRALIALRRLVEEGEP